MAGMTELKVDTEKLESLVVRMEQAAEKFEQSEYYLRRYIESGYNMRWGGGDEGMPEWLQEMFAALMHGR